MSEIVQLQNKIQEQAEQIEEMKRKIVRFEKDFIEKDELYEMCRRIEGIRYMACEMLDEFFDLYHPQRSTEDKEAVSYYFKLFRSKAYIISDFLFCIEMHLEKLGCYGEIK